MPGAASAWEGETGLKNFSKHCVHYCSKNIFECGKPFYFNLSTLWATSSLTLLPSSLLFGGGSKSNRGQACLPIKVNT